MTGLLNFPSPLYKRYRTYKRHPRDKEIKHKIPSRPLAVAPKGFQTGFDRVLVCLAAGNNAKPAACILINEGKVLLLITALYFWGCGTGSCIIGFDVPGHIFVFEGAAGINKHTI